MMGIAALNPSYKFHFWKRRADRRAHHIDTMAAISDVCDRNNKIESGESSVPSQRGSVCPKSECGEYG